MMKTIYKQLSLMVVMVVTMASINIAVAATLKPFVLSSVNDETTVAATIVGTKKALTSNGFTVVGEYAPYRGAHIIVVTNSLLKKAAASHKRAAYIAAQRVSITKVGDKVQTSYSNPQYWAAAYNVETNLSAVTNSLNKALGNIKAYGSKKGLSVSKLKKYHYAFGMEYFDEPINLASYNSHKKAVAVINAELASQTAGATKVYQIDIPGTKQTLFGVGLSAAKTSNKYMSDKFIMSEIDYKKIRSTAHLPYEMLVNDTEVEALHARFRIAISFPDLSMMGANSFMNIMPTPDAIKDTLTKVAGNTVDEFE